MMNFTNLYHPLDETTIPVNAYDERLILEKKLDFKKRRGKLIWYVNCTDHVLDPVKFQCIIVSVKELVFRGDYNIFLQKSSSFIDEMLHHVFASTAPHVIPLIRLPPKIKYENITTAATTTVSSRSKQIPGTFFTSCSIFRMLL